MSRARIDVRTLVIQGDADRILPITATGRRTAKRIKGARQVEVKDGPHGIPWTQAEEVNAELLELPWRDGPASGKRMLLSLPPLSEFI